MARDRCEIVDEADDDEDEDRRNFFSIGGDEHLKKK